MELDDLKQNWNQSTANIKSINNNIMKMIQHKSYGPVASLKRRFTKQLVVVPLVIILLINNLSKHHDIFSDVLFWCYICCCLVLVGYFYFSYRLLLKMQNMDGMVKSTLEQQVHTLQRSFHFRLVAIRCMMVVFIVLLEVLMYYGQEPSLVKWYAQPLAVRLTCYAGLLVLFYFFTKFATRRRYDRHLQNLKELVEQMQ